MEQVSIFDFKSYKLWLGNLFTHVNNRGLLSRVARDIESQRSYLSRVINSELQLTPDFAFKISKSLRLNADEQEYFLTLVDYERASSLVYRQFLQVKLQQLKSAQQDLGKKTARPEAPKTMEDMFYFTNWYYSAIHLLCSTAGPNTADSIAKRLSLDPKLVQPCLDILLQLGFLSKTGKNYSFKSGDVHVNKRSPQAHLHHSNWRAKAVLNAQMVQEDTVHFTNVQTMTLDDYHKILGLLREFIEKSQKIARSSEPEELVAVCLDAFIV